VFNTQYALRIQNLLTPNESDTEAPND
jgi:flagellar motor switch protein FliM